MKIGLIATKIRLNSIKKITSEYFPDIEFIYILGSSHVYTVELSNKLLEVKSTVDGFLFAGELEYQFYNNLFSPDIPTNYLRKDWSTLQNAFLKATTIDIDFKNVSIDSYSSSLVNNILDNIDIDKSLIHQYVLERSYFNLEYSINIFNKHKELYESGKVVGCITALSNVYDLLLDANIPSIYACPTTEAIVNCITSLVDACNTVNNSTQNTAMIIIKTLPKKEYSYIRQDEYLYMHEKMKVAEDVYYFAKSTKAAVISESIDKFIILMNKKDFLDYTNNMQRFYLLNSINSNTNCDVNIGIGYGHHPSEAKYNANLAIEKCDLKAVNQTYIVSKSNSVIGPLNFLSSTNGKNKLEEIIFKDISSNSNISQNMVFKLYTLMEKHKKNSFSAIELASLLHISHRSASRLLRKLEDESFATRISSSVTGSSGRPRDIYLIDFKLDAL